MISGAGLCWQHVGGVGSTTTTTMRMVMILLTTLAANILMGIIIASDEDNDDGDNVVCHCTETALLKVVNDLFLSLNKGNISVIA